MPTQSQILQNVINNNDPKGLSGSDANERIMTIIRAMASAIVAGGGGGGSVNLESGVTGVLPKENGGSGSASPSLVAGTNVTVDGDWPNQTVNASGGGGGSADSIKTMQMGPVFVEASEAGTQTFTVLSDFPNAIPFSVLAAFRLGCDNVTLAAPVTLSIQLFSDNGGEVLVNCEVDLFPMTNFTGNLGPFPFSFETLMLDNELQPTDSIKIRAVLASALGAGTINVNFQGKAMKVEDVDP